MPLEITFLKVNGVIILFSIKIFSQTILNCETCNKSILKKEEISALSIDELSFLTNDLYARKGYKFENEGISNYYSNQDWYKEGTNNNKIIFNDIEQKNLKLLQETTKILKTERAQLISQLKIFKTLILKKSSDELKKQFNFSTENDAYKYIKQVLEKLDFKILS